MMPNAIYEAIVNDDALNELGITTGRVFELQSINQGETPDTTNYLVVIDMQEATGSILQYLGFETIPANPPRTMELSVHISWDKTRDYHVINRILNRIDAILLPMENVIGSDGIRVTCIDKRGRTRNLQDDGWRTTTRHAIYSVLYDESAA